MKVSTVAVLAALGHAAAAAVTAANANAAFHTLQKWYNNDTGVWTPSTGWWNSANCLNVIADLAKIDDTTKKQAQPLYQDIYTKAQQYNQHHNKRYFTDSDSLFSRENDPVGFLASSYDDEGWWALAWIAVYDVTGNQEYLDAAKFIFKDIAAVNGTTRCGGGIWWDKVAAQLANRCGSESDHYLDYAKSQWNWFKNSGMINNQHLINDGLTKDCKNNKQTVYTYNQGVVLGALAELTRATKDDSYVASAKQIADAALKKLTDSNGILHEKCEPDCGKDKGQFKGIFARNLGYLQQQSPEDRYKTFLQKNADSVWKKDRSNGTQLSVTWSGPFVPPANASTQSSGLDVLVAYLATSG